MTKKMAEEKIKDCTSNKILAVNISKKYNEIEVVTSSPSGLIWLEIYKYQGEHIIFKDSKLLYLFHS